MTRMSHSSIDFRQLEAGIEPLGSRIEKQNITMWEKCIRLEEEDTRRVMACKNVKQMLLIRQGWRHGTTPLVDQNININTPKVLLDPMITIKAKMTQVELTKKKRNYTPTELARKTDEKIAEIDADVEIFTDGSASGSQQRGGAGIFAQDRNGNVLLESPTG